MKKTPCFMLFLVCFFLLIFNNKVNSQEAKGGKKMSMIITSPVFKEGDMIPGKYTCDGQDISPPLVWSNIPEGTGSFVLISDDPDAGGGDWVHWLIYNIPAEATGLPEAVPTNLVLDNGTRQGMNDFRRFGYGGPCPPGGPHRYFFKLYALDIILDLEAGTTKSRLLEAMQGHVLAQAQLIGKYKR